MSLLDLSVGKIYENTIQTIIDIINEIVYISDNKNFYYQIINIVNKNDRLFYIGIILIILSFVIYFIDGVSL
jgi:hypothetical protein